MTCEIAIIKRHVSAVSLHHFARREGGAAGCPAQTARGRLSRAIRKRYLNAAAATCRFGTAPKAARTIGVVTTPNVNGFWVVNSLNVNLRGFNGQ